jgi:hypothetical protein
LSLGGIVVSGNLLIPILGALGLALSWSYLDDEEVAPRGTNSP